MRIVAVRGTRLANVETSNPRGMLTFVCGSRMGRNYSSQAATHEKQSLRFDSGGAGDRCIKSAAVYRAGNAD
jgi:hypothetical protein